MQHFLRLCLWQAIIIGILTAHFPVSAEEERGIRLRGPKSSENNYRRENRDAFSSEGYGPITPKDTLWNIATRVRPDTRLSVYQVMQALYQENPQAFVDSNINHLVEGQYLKIPSFNNMMAINTDSAKKKSENHSKAWKKIQSKTAVAKEPRVKKKDLDTVKNEINDQLQKIDGQQQKRLENIQNDISDSINGLQAILKENDELRQRLTSFNDKLGIMQNEVAKSKEIKLQMDDMIKLQQALLAKAEARENELLLERQQAELAEQDFMSSLWFKVVMGTLPAILILLLLVFLFKRRKQASDEVFFNELESKKQAPTAKKEIAAEGLNLDDELDLSVDEKLDLDDELDLSLDEELNLDDELDLSLDDELNLDAELSIDLIENDDDEVIHLDEDDNLDDLEDILLDDNILDGGELDQGDLDSLLSGLDDEPEKMQETASEELEGGELNQDDLNDLLNGLDDLDDEGLAVEEPIEDVDVTDPDDIDALLASVDDSMSNAAPAAEKPVVEEPIEDVDVTDPDDIDALLESMSNTAPAAKKPAVEEPIEDVDVTDPDDIDALLESMSNSAPAAKKPAVEEPIEDIDVTDLDDIDEAMAKQSTIGPEDLNIQNEIAENEAKISGFTDEYVTPFLTADFSDVIADSDSELASETLTSSDSDELDDELDIDALLDSMSGNEPAPQQVKQDLPEAISQSKPDMGMDEQSLIDEATTKHSTLSPEDLKIQDEIAENKAKISGFTDEDVKPFLTADFSDVIADSDSELASEALTSTESDELDDELDIDALIADTISKDEATQSAQEYERDDIGDNLTGSSIDETLNTQVADGFTEAELSQLLTDGSLEGDGDHPEDISPEAIELSPDFTDGDVLAELLAETAESDEDELDVIEELANVDFDELLANIEEESATTPTEHDDIGDQLIDNSFTEENIQKAQEKEATNDYVSVDELISDSLDEDDISEPYEKTNIDVGLGQFAQNESGVDVDENGSMSSKLDLAKMYIEMSDEENAQVILQEVIFKGDTAQQVEAQALLDSL